ncbi:hypothetical protein Tco_1322760, partial [Tanacetum coccineum]
ESGFKQVEEDAHVILNIVIEAQKADEPVQSSFVPSDFTSKLLNLENPSPIDNEIASLMETSARHTTAIPEITSRFTITTPPPPPSEEAQAENQEFLSQVDSTMKTIIKDQVKAQVSKIMTKIEKYVTESLGAEVMVRSTNQPQTSYAVAASLSEFELKKILIDKMEANKLIDKSNIQKNLYNALVESYNNDNDIMSSYGDVVILKRGRHDQDKDEDPFAGSDRGMERRKSGKDAESSKDSSQAARAEEPPTSFDEFNDTSFDFSAFVMNRLKILNLTQEILVVQSFNLLKGTYKTISELEYHLEECSKATSKRLDWHDPENRPYSFDLRNPLPLIQDHRGRQIIPKDYFINKVLEYLKGGELSRRYSTSVIKTKATTYDLKWIEDLVQEVWSPVQVKYDQHAYLGTSHWSPKRQRFYGYASNLTSSKDVYSRKRIIAVTRLRIMKMYDYGHLEEIEVRQDDQKLYTFKEGDFKRLCLQDIKDMLLLLIQQKLSNLTIDERYDLNVALRMYTRRIVIQKRVEDL